MKKFALFLTVFSILTVLFSCNNKNDKNLKVTETTDNIPVYTFTKQDTTVVLDLVNQFFSYLENKELRSAVEMLNKLEGDSLAPLTGPAGQRQAIVLSMTPFERRHPEILKSERKQRIAKGSGRNVQEVNKLLTQFEQSKKMMKQIANGNFKMPF